MLQSGGVHIRPYTLTYIRLSWTFLMAALLLSLATVHLWDVLTSIVYMMLGAGMFLMYATEPSTETTQQAAAAGP